MLKCVSRSGDAVKGHKAVGLFDHPCAPRSEVEMKKDFAGSSVTSPVRHALHLNHVTTQRNWSAQAISARITTCILAAYSEMRPISCRTDTQIAISFIPIVVSSKHLFMSLIISFLLLAV